jgi:hypothetical protein
MAEFARRQRVHSVYVPYVQAKRPGRGRQVDTSGSDAVDVIDHYCLGRQPNGLRLREATSRRARGLLYRVLL